MATVVERPRADGRISYQIRTSDGYALDGSRKRPSKTWTPPEGWSEKRIAAELERQKVRFEDSVSAGASQDGNMKFQAFSEKWLAEYARKKLKLKTWSNYEERLPIVYKAFGHKKLKDIKTGHINAFYINLEEPGMRMDNKYSIKIDMRVLLKEWKMTQKALADLAGVSTSVIKSAIIKRNLSKKSADAISNALNKKLSDIFNVEHPDRVLSASTVHTYHRMISSIFSKAVKWGYIPFNPCTNAELPKMERKEAPYMDEDDVKRFLTLLLDAPLKWRMIVILDLFSGLRRGELFGLCWSDIDFESETINVGTSASYVKGFGVFDDTTKSETSTRIAKLSRIVFSLLREYKRWQDAQREACGDYWKDTDGRVFTGEDGRRIHPDSLTKWVKAFLRKHGFSEDLRLHSLRHTAVSLMINDGVNIVTVSKRIGHAQVSTTSNIYAHMIRSADEKAALVADKYADIFDAPQA